MPVRAAVRVPVAEPIRAPVSTRVTGRAAIKRGKSRQGGVRMRFAEKTGEFVNRGASRRTVVLAIAGLLTSLLMLPGFFGTGPAFADIGGPMATTKSFVDQALQILRDKNTPVIERRRQLKSVIEPRMDFTEMSRSALGYHWRSLTPDQRAQFSTLFTSFIEDAYLSKIQDYSG